MPNFCTSFSVESQTAIRIVIGHDILFVNEVRHIIERNRFLEIIWLKINFCSQKRRNCKVCRILRNAVGFIAVGHRFMLKGKTILFRQRLSSVFWSEAGFVEKFHQWLCMLVAGITELLFLRTILQEWFFSVAIWCFYMVYTVSNRPYMDNFSTFGCRCWNFPQRIAFSFMVF